MAKELPYFKFHCTEWMTGNIIFEPLEVQGLFINICALYWKRLGVLELSEIEQRYRKKSLIAKLSGRFFSVSDGFIRISFLDDQLYDREQLSNTNSGNGKLGGRPRKEKNKANAKPIESESKANESNIEGEREVEKEGEREIEQEAELWPSFNDFWDAYDKKTDRAKCEKKWDRLKQSEKEAILAYLPGYTATTPDKQYRKHPETFLNNRGWENELIVKTELTKKSKFEINAENTQFASDILKQKYANE